MTDAPATLDAAGVARAHAVAEAIDRYVAADPDLALSTIGMGMDALATYLRTQAAAAYADLAPWIGLASDVFAYVGDGRVGPYLADRFGDLLTPDDS